MPQASRVEGEIKSVYSDAEVSFELGTRGDFIVEIDGKVIFSKNDEDKQRFPFENEILELMKK
ncbi:MAG: hypothetical protein CR967_03815 [Proteobacteria bacterium]|nr:MAG: hypothetical protein CR967_03815 [Pseudomonadota bacterium]